MSPRVWNFIKIAAAATGALALLLAVLAFGTWKAAQHEESWYVEAVAAAEPDSQKQQAAAGDEFERQALDFRNEARRRGQWQAVFTDEHINGWLASDLQEKFPDLLPDHVHDPRVKIDEDFARAAFRVVTPQVDSVVIVGVDLYLTETPNELAVRFRDARAGLVPLPLKRVTDIATRAAEKTNIIIRWAHNDGDPVALIQIPERVDGIDGQLIVENVDVRDGEVYLSGRTVKDDGTGGSTNVQGVIVSQLFRSDTLHR